MLSSNTYTFLYSKKIMMDINSVRKSKHILIRTNSCHGQLYNLRTSNMNGKYNEKITQNI